jgi:acetyl-CoA carboxylase biotin carboxyl carrier protein
MPGNDFYPRMQSVPFMHENFSPDAGLSDNRMNTTGAGSSNAAFKADSTTASADAAAKSDNASSSSPATSNDAGLEDVLSPMLGVYYAAASPESKPFIQVGDKVKKGDILCIIEAMKLMNEILAESDGEVAKICVENGHIVEFGQVILKMK